MPIIYILLTLACALAIVGFLAGTDYLRDRAEHRRWVRNNEYRNLFIAQAATNQEGS